MKAFWQQCEGQVIDGFPLRQYLGGAEDQAVFLTEYGGETHVGEPQRKAAIKLTRADPDSTESHLRRWRLAAELSHPNLMRLFERGSWHLDKIPLLYVVMEYADEDLSQVIPERPLTVAEAKEMLEPALSALTYLHSSGFAHGRLKLSNFMAIDGRLKISSDSVAQIGGSLTPADDVCALGLTLVEALTQRRPVWNAGDTRDAVLPETIPAEFQEIARNALRRDARSRWTVAQIQQQLSGRPVAEIQPRLIARPAAPSKRLSPSMISTALLAGALAIVAGTLMIRNREIAPGGAPQNQAVPSQPAPAAPQPAPAAATPAPVIPAPHVESKPTQAPPGHDEVVQRVLPEVLPRARNSIHGKVLASVRVDVDPSGNVSNAAIESGPSQYFSNAALNAARRWKFTPAEGPRAWILKFEFTRNGTKVVPVKSG
jgi:TonB family protein